MNYTDALTRIAAIEIERGMDADEATERGMSAVHFARQALFAQAVAVAEPQCSPTLTECPRCKNEISRCDGVFATPQPAPPPEQAQQSVQGELPPLPEPRITPFPGAGPCYFTDSQMHDYVLADRATRPPAVPAAVWTQEQCDKIVTLGAELRARFKPDPAQPAVPAVVEATKPYRPTDEEVAVMGLNYVHSVLRWTASGYVHTPERIESLRTAYRIVNRLVNEPAQPAAPVAAQGLTDEQVEWVVNDSAELGVKIGQQFFWLYKGHSLVYGADSDTQVDGLAVHDDGKSMHWRHVFKREFGECCHPINYGDLNLIGTVSLDDSSEWEPLPAAICTQGRQA